MRKGIFLVIGSPLIDLIVTADEHFLKLYNLKANNAIAATETSRNLFEHLKKFDIKFQAGGCGLNTARTLQTYFTIPEVSTVLGTIGNDSYGRMLKEKLTEDKVKYIFEVIENESTGKCAVVLTGEDRSLCTDLAASKYFNLNHLKGGLMWDYVEQAKYFYIPGFFLSVSPQIINEITQHCRNTKKILAFNLSAPFLMEVYHKEILELIPLCDILFGNEAETRAFARTTNFTEENLKEILLHINRFQMKNCQSRRITVITRGPGSVFLVENGNGFEFPVSELEKSKIKDTNAAGDAFVGGFLSRFILNESLDKCVMRGIEAAAIVIQNIGCSFANVAS